MCGHRCLFYNYFLYPSKPEFGSDRRRNIIFTAAREAINVRISATAIKYRIPSRPKKIGRIRTKPTPKTTSRRMESAVEAAALPSA